MNRNVLVYAVAALGLALAMVFASSKACANEVVPLLEFRTMWGLRIQLANDEGWCHAPEKAAIMYDGNIRTNGCWKIDSSGEVISIEWPSQTTNHPRRRFHSLEV